jgi:RNA polymerase sigma factor (sigma-70 family)
VVISGEECGTERPSGVAVEIEGSELLGSLSELRGFVTDAERSALGEPLAPTTSENPLQDLRDASAAQFDRELQEGRLEELFRLRVEVACHCLASLTDQEADTLRAKAAVPSEELEAARTLAAEALSQGIGQRGESLFTVLSELGRSGEDGDGTSVHDLIGEVRKLGRWPGPQTADHVVAYRQALGEAVLRNARFAFWATRRHVPKPSTALELTALCGLRKALERFDPHRGAALSTYAQWWVRAEITRTITDYGADVRAPVYFWEDRFRLLRVIYEYVAEHGQFPGRDILLTHADLSERVRVDKVLRLGLVPLRSAWARTCDRAEPEADALFDPKIRTHRDQLLEAALQEVLDTALEGLKTRREEIIRRRYGIDGPASTLQEIGDDKGLSRERIRQLESMALKDLARTVGKELAQAVQSVDAA